MANLGIERLGTVNSMIAFVGEKLPHPALDSTGSWPTKTYGSSIAGRAEEVLDRVTRRVLEEGTYVNTLPMLALVVASNAIQFGVTSGAPANALRIEAVGHARNVTLRADKVFDLDLNTDTLVDDDVYYLKVMVDLDFDALAPGVKEDIVRAAQVEFQAIWRNDPAISQFLGNESAIKDATRLQSEGKDPGPAVARAVTSRSE